MPERRTLTRIDATGFAWSDGRRDVETVRRHYFNFKYDEDDQVIDRWELPKKLPSAVAQLVQPGSDLTN